VGKGQVIAVLGSTGRSIGAHVHFEVLHNGKAVDPKKYIATAM
ncbi:MAG: M23 family metallopeptidase, partial [Gammaproteobacteria bacterium]|nr:M23 family metallopeptidase [Gammaproteobacteria bacterium]